MTNTVSLLPWCSPFQTGTRSHCETLVRLMHMALFETGCKVMRWHSSHDLISCCWVNTPNTLHWCPNTPCLKRDASPCLKRDASSIARTRLRMGCPGAIPMLIQTGRSQSMRTPLRLHRQRSGGNCLRLLNAPPQLREARPKGQCMKIAISRVLKMNVVKWHKTAIWIPGFRSKQRDAIIQKQQFVCFFLMVYPSFVDHIYW